MQKGLAWVGTYQYGYVVRGGSSSGGVSAIIARRHLYWQDIRDIGLDSGDSRSIVTLRYCRTSLKVRVSLDVYIEATYYTAAIKSCFVPLKALVL